MHNTLETRRLLLKPISEEDIYALAPIFADPEVMKLASSGPFTPDQTRHEIEEPEGEKPVTGGELEIHRQNHVIFYTDAEGKVTVDVFFAHENFWLTQKTMAELFGVKTSAISRHLKNIYASKELLQEATVSKMEIVQVEGHREITREVEVYKLDATIAVGYRSTTPVTDSTAHACSSTAL